MRNIPVWLKLAFVAGLLLALVATTAASFFGGAGANTHNGFVYSYVAGKSISIRGFGRELIEYNINSKTQILPAALSSGLRAGAQVTVVGQCYTRSMTSGCNAISIFITLPAAGSASSTAAPTQAVATPTP